MALNIGGSGNARKPHGEIEGGALHRHQRRGRSLELEQALTGRYRRPLRHQQPHLPMGIEFMEQRLQQHATATTPQGC